jgi:hypothetical protein
MGAVGSGSIMRNPYVNPAAPVVIRRDRHNPEANKAMGARGAAGNGEGARRARRTLEAVAAHTA